jgi:RNA polymerase sigma factor (sigma-70 family)
MIAAQRGEMGTDIAHRRATAPDEEFAQCYQQLFDRAMRLAYRMTRDAAAAEDVAAEAMARAYSRWATVRRLEQPEAWVLRVTMNLVIDAGRRKALFARLLPAMAADRTTEPAFDDDIAVRRALVAALATLPTRQREAIALRYLAELDEESISRFLDIAPSSVRTHVQRGLVALRQRLGSSIEGGLGAAF